MNIQRKSIKVELQGKEYDMVLDFASAIEFQSIYGKSIFVGLDMVAKEQDLYALAVLIATTVKDSKNKCIGMDFVGKLDLITSLEYFTEKLGELMANSLPQSDDEEEGK